jgi:GTP-binding protein
MFSITIIGRPNVGKSTLFNRLSGTKHAIVHDLPGVTRDIRQGEGSIGSLDFIIIDTPGLEQANASSLASRMTNQTINALSNTDLIILLVDGKAGLVPDDKFFSDLVRKYQKPVILVANKCESNKVAGNIADFYGLGYQEIACISAAHGEGLANLYDLIAPYYEAKAAKAYQDKITLAIVGRPNAGKSTLINHLLQEERVLTGPEAGITRDAIAIDWKYQNHHIRLIDTAGIRKRANVTSAIEQLALEDSFRAIQYANVVILLLDATLSLQAQDIAIASKVLEEGRALVIGVNKWDQIEDKSHFVAELNYLMEKSLNQAKGISICYISAIHAINVNKLMQASIEAYELWNMRLSTSKINDWLEYALAKHQLPLTKSGRRVKIKYATQVKSRPPTFVLFTNYPKEIPETYIKYLIGSLREYLELPGIPIRIMLRKSGNPYNEGA